jgi:xanthine/uracil/vitamin C permease (AzgA family)
MAAHLSSLRAVSSVGARTGLHSVVVAVLFLLFLPFVPVLHAVPSLVTAPALVIVGCAMMGVSRFIDWENGSEALPAFLTSTLIAFSYSIAVGVVAGLVAFALLKAATLVAGGESAVDEQQERLPSLERRKSGSMLAYTDSPRETPKTAKAQYGAVQ